MLFSDNQKTTVTCSALELHKDSPTCTSEKKTKGEKNILLGGGGGGGLGGPAEQSLCFRDVNGIISC